MYRFIAGVITGLALIGLIAGHSLTTHAQDACPSGLAPRLVAGEYAQVTPGAGNRVRAEPGTSGEVIGEIPGEAIFAVLGGPQCADNFNWWRVQYGDLIGWTAEGRDDYWLLPLGALRAGSPMLADISASQAALYRGVGFRFSADVALDAIGETVAAVDAGGTPFDLPERIRFSFTRYPAGYAPVELNIYRADEYETVMMADLSGLRRGLAERPPPMGYHANAVVNAATLVAVQSRYVEFANGSGIRSLIHWAQAPDWIATLYYVYNGLTDDGEYYIEAIFALTDLPQLPADLSARFEVDYDALLADYEAYISAVNDLFLLASPDDYTPGLHHLDALIASLEVAVISVEEEERLVASRPTPTPHPTLAPTPTPTPLPECRLFAFNDTNLRVSPSVEDNIVGVMRAGLEYTGVAQFQRRGEPFPWWFATRTGLNAGWVRADFVDEVGDCDDLPIDE